MTRQPESQGTKPLKTLDEIIDEYQVDFERQRELYDYYGGCQCGVPNARPPCGFCEKYDWEADPFGVLER